MVNYPISPPSGFGTPGHQIVNKIRIIFPSLVVPLFFQINQLASIVVTMKNPMKPY